ncbi:uncharacterized protein [Montipora foliosa]|uniref:uncharacterized protein n=1 Tax=Montipora foliosa TaxID=591990 RepID=UPI0035F14670
MDNLKKLIKDAIEANHIEEVIKSIHEAIGHGQSNFTSKDEVQALLNECLYYAVRFGRYEIVKELVKNGADANYEDPLKQSVLLRTVFSRRSEEVDNILIFLLENGSDINHRSINGQSDFMSLVASEHLSYHQLVRFMDSVKDINEVDLRTGGGYLHLVSRRPDDESKAVMIKKLLEKGLEVNGRDNNDDTPLHLMATIADCASMRFLVENGADFLAKNRLGETVLHSLVSSNEFDGFQESLAFLIEMGMDINGTDSSGKTSIHHALLSKDTNEAAIRELLKVGIKVNAKDANGRNEVYVAVEAVDVSYCPSDLDRRAAVIKLLAEVGVDVSEGDMYGITPLHLATMKSDLEILVTLLDAGADIMKRSNCGATALHWSCRTYNMAHVMIHSYFNEGQDINVVDDYGSTALHWAVWFRQLPVSQSLLQVGCDYLIHDNAGNTPVDLAKKVFFDPFLDLVEDEKYKDLDGLTLQEPILKCNDSDPFHACPLLRYARKEEGKLDMEPYIEHLDRHKASLARCFDASVDTKHMGLFYNIEENISVPKTIETLMTSVKKRVGELNPLFNGELRLAGSVFEGTKVNLPDEFDYLWVLTEFCEAFFPVESPTFPESFVKLKLKKDADAPRFRRYLTKQNFLDSSLFIRDFNRKVNEAIMDILKHESQFSNLMCLQQLNEIFCTISSLAFQYLGREGKYFRISVDVVPTIWFSGWTPRDLKTMDAFSSRVEKSPGFYVIIKTPDRCHVKDFTLFFRVSYAYLEQCIMRAVPEFIKMGYIVLKILAESGYLPKVVDHDNQRRVKKYVTSYHLKTCFLHELELWKRDVENTTEIMESEDKRKLALVWAKRVVNHYEKSIQGKFLATLFEPKRNLLGLVGFEDVIQDGDIFVDLVNLLQYMLGLLDHDEPIRAQDL